MAELVVYSMTLQQNSHTFGMTMLHITFFELKSAIISCNIMHSTMDYMHIITLRGGYFLCSSARGETNLSCCRVNPPQQGFAFLQELLSHINVCPTLFPVVLRSFLY